MKKLLFFLLAFLSVPAFAEVGDHTSFDFTNPKELNISPAIQSYDGSFDGQGVQVTSKVITSKDIQISFSLGLGQGGVYIPRYSITIDGKTTYYYVLEMRSGSTIKIRTTNGCELDSVKFTGSTGTLTSSSTGLFDAKTMMWKAKTSTDTVVIENGAIDTGIQTIEVYYKKQSEPLYFVSSTPSSGSEVSTFDSMTLNFNSTINTSNYNESGITLSGPGISSPVAMSASVSGSSVTLSTGQTYTAYGDYTVYVPAGAFKNSEGGSHDAISIPFRVNPKRDTLKFLSVIPDATQDTVNQLPESIEVIYNEFVSVPVNSMATFYKDGVKQFTAPITLTEDNSKSVTIAHGRGVVAEEGVWTIKVPEKAVYNGMMGDEAEERWNPAFTLSYTVESEVTKLLALAKKLKSNTDYGMYGYPVDSSEGYTVLTAVINKGKDATVEEIKEAMGKYYTETNVKMPVAGKWYRIAGVNDSSSVAYLTYADQKVTLKSSYTSADAFLAVEGSGGMEFKTKDERYLTVLGNPSGFDGFTYHQSGKGTQLNVAKLAVENADSTKIIGKFTISGWLGRDGNDEDLGNSTAAISYPSLAIVKSPTKVIYFSGATSSAFIFEETTEPAIQAEITFDNNLKGIEIDNAGDPITLVVHNVQSADILNGSLPYFEKQNQIGNPELISTTSTILTKVENSSYEFNVNTTGLEAGEYLLYVPAETFDLTPISVVGTPATLSITIKSSIPTPDVTFSNNLKSIEIEKAGDEIILVVHNVQSADILNGSLPYFEKQNQTGNPEQIQTTSPILKKVENSTYDFNVNTTGLEAGEYLLYVPLETFSYTPTSDYSSVVVLSITIKKNEPSYTYPVTFNVKKLMDPDVHYSYVKESVWLNDLIFYAYTDKVSSIVPNPDAVIKITNINGALVRTGHLETYPNYKTDMPYDWLQNTIALRAVLDPPFRTDEKLDGTYYVVVPRGALGDTNFGIWLMNNSYTGDCMANEETYFSFFASGIEEINSEDIKKHKVYDLTGRRVSNAKKPGIYIINGRKVIVK